jgi:RNA polymerase sigma-70 factor (ECF subfamily)
LPDSYLSRAGNPEARATGREGVRLALVAAFQLLPPRQRAVLVLRDVLEFSATEVAAQLDTSVAAVNSALQRARAALAAASPRENTLREPDDRAVRETVDRYIRAFESADVDMLVTLLTDDAVLKMPPVPLWYAGRIDYGRFISRVFSTRGTGWRMIPTGANGQPAVAAYCPEDTGVLRLHTLQVLTVTDQGIAHNVVFQDPEVSRPSSSPRFSRSGIGRRATRADRVPVVRGGDRPSGPPRHPPGSPAAAGPAPLRPCALGSAPCSCAGAVGRRHR